MHYSEQVASTVLEDPFLGSEFVWPKGVGAGRNLFVSFDFSFRWTGDQVTLHLFADTRYRLFVNEAFVAYGPPRFVTQFPEFDTFDLRSWLQSGVNVIRVEVNFYGTSSFQTMADGKPGFIAAGGTESGEVDFKTPGAWTARVHEAWDPCAPLFSFAQNPAEICDTRVLARELERISSLELDVLSDAQRPWGKLSPRSSPFPGSRSLRPPVISVTGPVEAGEQLLGVQSHDPGFRNWDYGPVAKRRSRRFLTWIRSPRAQIVRISCFWADLECNGKAVVVDTATIRGNHGHAHLNLRQGWNFLSARFDLLTEYWPYLVGYPREAGISLHARPDTGEGAPWMISPIEETKAQPVRPVPAHTFCAPDGWEPDNGDVFRVTPARLVAWEEPAEPSTRQLPSARLSETGQLDAQSALWCFDFQDEYYGHPMIEVDAPEGTVMDVSYDDWQRADGCTHLYASNPFTDAADRFILRGGIQRIEVCNPRGGIYLQVTMRVPAGSPPAVLAVRDVFVRLRQTVIEGDGSFRCGDPDIDWAWQKGTHTLAVSTDEAYTDCPWRERSSYVGDTLVSLHLHRLISHDLSIAKRTLTIFGLAQMPDGRIPGCAPSWMRPTALLADFELHWIRAVRDCFSMTGDARFAKKNWPVIERFWDGATSAAETNGLWNAAGRSMYLDWAVYPGEGDGDGNAALNILRYAAIRASADLARVLGRTGDATRLAADASRLKTGIEARLWLNDEKRFAPFLGGRSPALHANVLALRYGVGDPAALLAYLEPLLRKNLRTGLSGANGYCELFFLFFVLEALGKHGQAGLAETLIREHYGYLCTFGYPTLNEFFAKANQSAASCCHTWSSGGAIYASRYILGLRQAEFGNPDRWLIAPASHSIHEASGVLPHPKGSIRIDWRREGKGIVVQYSAPKGVEIVTGPGVIARESGRRFDAACSLTG